MNATHRYLRALPLALATLPLPPALSPAIAKPAVEVAFVLDTTGSMGGLIEGAKRKIWSIATAIVDANPDAEIRMGLVAYRDIGDDYVTKTFDLTTDIQDLYANLLELKARGGGDWPESVNEALDVAVNKLHWTQGGDSRRIVFLVGDAPPHMDYAQDTKYPMTLAVAQAEGHHRQRGAGRQRARHRAGVARDRAERQRPLHPDPAGRRPGRGDRDAVRRRDHHPAGRDQRHRDPLRPARRAEAHRGQDQAVVAGRGRRAGSASEMASYINKRAKASSEAVTGGGDLVSRRRGRPQKLAAVKDDELPDDLRALKPEQRIDEARQADEAAQGAQREARRAGAEARRLRRRPARQGAAEGVVVRPRGRGDAEGADQAVRSSAPSVRGRCEASNLRIALRTGESYDGWPGLVPATPEYRLREIFPWRAAKIGIVRA